MQNRVTKIKYKFFRHTLVLPLLVGMAPALLFLDICLEIYHKLGFPLCGIKKVKRSNFIKIDRYKLQYLNWIEKMWCAYCGYANGLAAYTVEVAARTEKYWCGIKHQKRPGFQEPKHHANFIKYGDEDAYKKRFEKK